MPPFRDLINAPIPLSVVAFLMIQTAGFVWWGASATNHMDRRIAALEMIAIQADKVTQSRNGHEGRIIVLEQMAVRVRDDLAEIKVMLRGTKTGDMRP